MKFGQALQDAIHEPWQLHYVDYSKLKKLLREDEASDSSVLWSDADETVFVEELLNVELEKVTTFYTQTYESLRRQTTDASTKLEAIAIEARSVPLSTEADACTLDRILCLLDSIAADVTELERYIQFNYTGFLKVVKKHDRKRGSNYRVRPLLQIRLADVSLDTEKCSLLGEELDDLHAVAQTLRSSVRGRQESTTSSKRTRDIYTSQKFWLSSANLSELKTHVLRHLPVLIYNTQSHQNEQRREPDPVFTSLYLDNASFSLYHAKLQHSKKSTSMRLRWFGQLADKPVIYFEKKTTDEDGYSEDISIPLKEKYVQAFLEGRYKVQKRVDKLRQWDGADGDAAANLQRSIDEIQSAVEEQRLEPMVRAIYKRTAYQIPGDDDVRILIDTDLAFVREDVLDAEKPCRTPGAWHRPELDRSGYSDTTTDVGPQDVSNFPYALMEVKVRKGVPKKTQAWVTDLINSSLVQSAPRFSKFVHGVAELFDDHVNSFPFWLSNLESGLGDDLRVATSNDPIKRTPDAPSALAKDEGKTEVQTAISGVASPGVAQAEDIAPSQRAIANTHPSLGSSGQPDAERLGELVSNVNISNSKYAKAHQKKPLPLPIGVRNPGILIKDRNPVRVEPKVWLANQRTFIKWQHISVLLASLSLGLYNAAAGTKDGIAQLLALIYTAIAIFAGVWGWYMYMSRSKMIEARSGRDLDHIFGPSIVCVGLIVALCLNFAFKVSRLSPPNGLIEGPQRVTGPK